MLLFEKVSIHFKACKVTRKNFPSCPNLVDYLNSRGIFDCLELNDNRDLLIESCCSDLEINLFSSYFVFGEIGIKTKNQVFLSEIIIHLFFHQGIDLMKATEVRNFFEIAASYFPACFPIYNRKTLGSIIRKSKRMISYKQGGYILINDVQGMWDKHEIEALQIEVRKELMTSFEIDPNLFFEKHKKGLAKSKIYNSHYMFSVLKYLNEDDDIFYYRNTFNKKIRRIYKC